jgi:GntR family transcriptional regulator
VTARQRITARSADPFSARHLGIEIGAPLLCVMRVSRDASGRPIAYLRSHFRPDRYEIELDFEPESPAQRAVWRMSRTPQKNNGATEASLLDLEAGEE